MSQHKFASNVVEKCVEYGSKTERGIIIEEILGSKNPDKLVYVFFIIYFHLLLVSSIIYLLFTVPIYLP